MNPFKLLTSSATAALCVLSCVTAQGNTAECAIQFFATGMTNKGVETTITTSLSTFTRSADFGVEKAIVLFDAPLAGGALDGTSMEVAFTATYEGCTFEGLTISNIADSGGGRGNCYTIEQNCGPAGSSVYGTVYVDIYCLFPGQTTPFRMDYFQNRLGVDEVINC